MLTKTTTESCLKSGNLKIAQIPNLHKQHVMWHKSAVQTTQQHGSCQPYKRG